MSAKFPLCSESTLTERYQTTVPQAVRQALGLSKHDKIRYSIQPNGQVLISRVNQEEKDPLIEKFLDFLAKDIEKNPHHLQPLSLELSEHLQSLVCDVDVDLDAPLSDEDE